MTEESRDMAVPLDRDGFLRRECPTCEREFKWYASEDGTGAPAPVGGYYCPYCAIQAPADGWFTAAQIELAQNTIMREMVGPELELMAKDLRRSGSGSLIKIDMEYHKPPAMDPLVEADDMRRVDFECHPSEPIKVLDDWSGDVHCLICAGRWESG